MQICPRGVHLRIHQRWQNRSGEAQSSRSLISFGSHFGRPWCVPHGSGRVCPLSWNYLWPQGGRPPRFPASSVGLGLLPGAWGVPKRGMQTGPEAFLELRDACGLRPCDRTHLKKGLVPPSYTGGVYGKYRLNPHVRSFPLSGMTLQCLGHISACRDAWRTVLVGCSPFTGITAGLRGPFPQVLTLIGWVRFIAWRLKGECR